MQQVTLKPGDYVSTEGMDEETYHKVAKAFMAAGAVDCGDTVRTHTTAAIGWDSRDDELWSNDGGCAGFDGRNLAIAQVLGDANAQPADADGWIEWHGGKCPVERGTLVDVKHRDGDEGYGKEAGIEGRGIGKGPATAEDWSHDGVGGDIIAYRLHKQKETNAMTIIDDLKAKRQARDEAETAYQDALAAVRAELGGGFTLDDNGAQESAVRDLPPEEWREGDLVVGCKNIDDTTVGTVYKLYMGCDGRLSYDDDAGDECKHDVGAVAFHSRP